MPWDGAGTGADGQGIEEMFQRIDEALALLEAGLPL
jgi:predicted RNase H-like HicB family nuclease